MTTTGTKALALAALVAASGALGCFSERVAEPDDNAACDGTSTPCPVRIADNDFSPATRVVIAGSTVRWTNQGGSPHTSTSASWDSGTLGVGQTFERTFPTAGTFGYECIFHSGMTGTIVVE